MSYLDLLIKIQVTRSSVVRHLPGWNKNVAYCTMEDRLGLFFHSLRLCLIQVGLIAIVGTYSIDSAQHQSVSSTMSWYLAVYFSKQVEIHSLLYEQFYKNTSLNIHGKLRTSRGWCTVLKWFETDKKLFQFNNPCYKSSKHPDHQCVKEIVSVPRLLASIMHV